MVNKLVLGTVQFGCQYGINSSGRPNQKTVQNILKEASWAGIQTLDTSSAYGDAEEVLGQCETNSFNIISKYPKGTTTVSDQFNKSLVRLNRNSLYGYLLHHFEIYRNNSAIWEEFLRLRDEGRVTKIGFSLYQPEELELLFSRNVDFSLLQIPYNLLDRKFEPYLKELHEKRVEVHVRSTFLQGLFFMDRNTLPDKLEPLRPYLLTIDDYAFQNNVSVAQVALNFNLQNPLIDGVLIGVDNELQLKQNVDVVGSAKVELDINVKEKELLNPVNWK